MCEWIGSDLNDKTTAPIELCCHMWQAAGHNRKVGTGGSGAGCRWETNKRTVTPVVGARTPGGSPGSFQTFQLQDL